ncbi:MAG: carbohydrate kinase [Clostridiales bacterium]|nr:carbohydrate kinase [Clostridiales bacterium]
MKDAFLVIGGLNMDILGTPSHSFVQRDSNIGRVRLTPGGVGRNIASHLARLGAPVELMAVLGNDVYAGLLEQSCTKADIGLRYAVRSNLPTCMYLAIHDTQGDMLAAINDMEAMKALSPESIMEKLRGQNFRACVLDANLSQQSLEAAARMECPLIADPVSCDKAERLVPIFPRLTAIKPNLMEARLLSGREGIEEAAAALLDKGVRQVYISLGSGGCYYASQQERGYLPAVSLPPVPATGAGDAMVAGLTIAISEGKTAAESAAFGQECAANHLRSQQLQ